MNFDLVIVGGGPAGATLARLLPRKMRCAVIYRSDLSKPCGGLLSEDAQRSLARYDITLPKDVLVDPQIFSVKTIDLEAGLVRHYQRTYLNMDRQKFDAWLLDMVPCQRIDGQVIAVERLTEGYRVTLVGGQQMTCRYLVGADGANSVVRRALYPEKRIRSYTAIQQWFPERHPKPFYSCIFDPDTSDACSWSISKDQVFIFGGAFAPRSCREMFDRQKQRLQERFAFVFGEPLKTEACMVLRPSHPGDVSLGRDGAFLIGEAAGFISTSSFEGISFAMDSARLLAEVLTAAPADLHQAYRRHRPSAEEDRCKAPEKPLHVPADPAASGDALRTSDHRCHRRLRKRTGEGQYVLKTLYLLGLTDQRQPYPAGKSRT